MAETKITGIRADETTISRFKEISEQYSNSAECLKALINAHELAQAKGILAGQETNINDFQSHLDSIMRAYITVLDLTANTENRIRQEFQRQLDSKDNIIADLQERIKQAETNAALFKEQVAVVTAETTAHKVQSEEEIVRLKKEFDSVKKQSVELSENLVTIKSQIADKQQIIDSLNQKISDAKVAICKADEAETRVLEVESELKSVKSKLSEEEKLHKSDVEKLNQQLETQKTNAERDAELAKKLADADKKSALAELKGQYIDELDKLRQEIKELMSENYTLKSSINDNKY